MHAFAARRGEAATTSTVLDADGRRCLGAARLCSMSTTSVLEQDAMNRSSAAASGSASPNGLVTALCLMAAEPLRRDVIGARCRSHCPLGCGSFLPKPLYLDDGSFPPMPTAVELESTSALGSHYPCHQKMNRGNHVKKKK